MTLVEERKRKMEWDRSELSDLRHTQNQLAIVMSNYHREAPEVTCRMILEKVQSLVGASVSL